MGCKKQTTPKNIKLSDLNTMLQKKKKKVSRTNIRKFEWQVGGEKEVISKKSCFTTQKIFNEAVNVN